MFSFFKRWRSGSKEKAVENQVVENDAEVSEKQPEQVELVPTPIEIPSPSLIPEPVVPNVSSLPDLPEPDEDGKVRIKVSLNEFMPPISEEELEAAALAEIPEDSPLRYQKEEQAEAVEEDEQDLEAEVVSDDHVDESLEAIEDTLEGKTDATWDAASTEEEVVSTEESVLSNESDDRLETSHPTAEHMNQEPLTESLVQEVGFEDSVLAEDIKEETSTDTVKQILEVEEGQEVVHSATPAPEKASWFSRLKSGLARTGSSISSLFVGVKVDEDLFEELETALIMADAGVEATQSLLTKLRAKVKKERIDDPKGVKKALHQLLTEHLSPLEKRFILDQDKTNVVMIAGVNGAGKTTSIGKLAYHFQESGASVLLAAGDTFRAAAREQLMAWGDRNNVQVISQDGGDPAAVAFDAVNAGKARKTNVVMVDTAGRLPTQTHLMEELKKIRRVITKAEASAPHEVLLVIDGNTGQNALAQIRAFDAVLNLTGLVVTKLDGTAKGGTLAAVAAGSQGVRPIPVYWIGVGESLHDLQPFVASEFAAALLGNDA